VPNIVSHHLFGNFCWFQHQHRRLVAGTSAELGLISPLGFALKRLWDCANTYRTPSLPNRIQPAL